MCIRKNKLANCFIIAFICVCMIFTFNVKRSYAFEIRDVGDGIKKWVVVTVIMLATGTQIVADNLSPEKVKKLGDMYVSYYSELTEKVGDDMKSFFVGGAATLANITSNAITSINGGVKISLQFINTHLAMLKSLADQWIANIKTVIGDIETFIVDGTKNVPNDYIKQGLKKLVYFKSGMKSSDVVNNIWPNLPFNEYDGWNTLFYYSNYGYWKGNYNVLRASSQQFESASKFIDLTILRIFKVENGIHIYFGGHYLDKNGEVQPFWSSGVTLADGILAVAEGVKVTFGEIELGLPDFANKPLSLDGVQDYSDNIINHGIDNIGYVDPHTGSIDYSNKDSTKPLTLDDPGTISYPVPLPNSLDDSNVNVWDPTLPVVGTWDYVDHKVIDKPSDYPLDVITDTPDDIPVDDVDKNPRGHEFKPDVKGKYFLDWHEIFPFCIPWDIYAIATMFKAEPIAPRLELDLGTATNVNSKKVVLDLKEYDNFASILRNLVLLVFCIGLAMITRDIIRG